MRILGDAVANVAVLPGAFRRLLIRLDLRVKEMFNAGYDFGF